MNVLATVTTTVSIDLVIKAPAVCFSSVKTEGAGTLKQMKLEAAGDGSVKVVASSISDKVTVACFYLPLPN